MHFVLIEREEQPECPGGVTVSLEVIPEGTEVELSEYVWGRVSLWFVDSDEFTDDEREDVFSAVVKFPKWKQAATLPPCKRGPH